ncbi:peptide chain release factor N(5)-glutamine methyltransferase [Rhodobacteraceae bacterium KMM 6894]|nr:peptide chain release factor N(5)-glutamine methyltransferase [Rhodobacteraceae bacterium KMM 6894]
MSGTITVGQAIRQLGGDLAGAGIGAPLREARLIAADVLGLTMAQVTLAEQDPISADMQRALFEIAAPRLERRPLSHILGRRAFFKHEFHVTPDVLDPRPETETLVVAALAQSFERVLDLGTGSGAILLSLLTERSDAKGVGTDLSPAALRVAQGNAARLGVGPRATFLMSDWFSEVRGRFNLIVSNPPYIAVDEMAGLAPELGFEPRMALTDEADGLSAYRVICAGAVAHLVPGGALMVEIGPTQSAAVSGLMRAAGLVDVCVLPDLDGRDRVVCGYSAAV